MDVGGGGEGAGVGGIQSGQREDRLRYRCVECGKGFITPSKLQRHSYRSLFRRVKCTSEVYTYSPLTVIPVSVLSNAPSA